MNMSRLAEEDLWQMIEGLPIEAQNEIRRFADEIERLEQGQLDPDDFKRFRLENGVYGIRGNPDLHMVRVKVRFGQVTPDQLDALAEIADRFTPNRKAHITTRQDFQFHYVKRRDVPVVLARIVSSGLTTREACGNTVRNVTACPLAGISPTERFDVTPYADAVSKYFLRNPINQNLPRKFKIAFEGCHQDHVRTPIHDIGAVAATSEKQGRVEPGFRLYIAGGLGAQPTSAQLLEEFTPADLLIPTCEAIIRVFDRHGNRRPEHAQRMRARMKFLAREWGIEKLRTTILNERRFILATRSGLAQCHIEAVEEIAPEISIPRSLPLGWSSAPEYERWRSTNVLDQKQAGYHAVLVRCGLGDITSDGLRAVARVARRWCGGRVRTTITQNLMLRWVPQAALPWVYCDLAEAGLAEADAHRIADITRCPGADTCQLALTHSRGLAEAIGAVIADEFNRFPELANLSIKISGCMNSCGQHHIADIGFYGASSEVEGRLMPQYIVLVGGRTQEGRAEFGKPVAKVPANRAPEVARRLLNFYRQQCQDAEPFGQFVERIGLKQIRDMLAPLAQVLPFESAPELYRDLGDDCEVFTAELGPGECAA
jgi:sulfite reductase beta subunit-like hemoprotein